MWISFKTSEYSLISKMDSERDTALCVAMLSPYGWTKLHPKCQFRCSGQWKVLIYFNFGRLHCCWSLLASLQSNTLQFFYLKITDSKWFLWLTDLWQRGMAPLPLRVRPAGIVWDYITLFAGLAPAHEKNARCSATLSSPSRLSH